ncbi:MAG: DNA-3-methyladenine glycosylase 2 family protein [Raoultibacter sp.]
MSAKHIFIYSDQATDYLRAHDARLGAVIDVIGPIERKVDADLFSSLTHSIVGQQISTKAHQTIWNRMIDAFGEITPEKIAACSREELQKFGTTFKKVDYLKSAADKVLSGEFDLAMLEKLPDEEVCRRLCTLDGVGTWTAEMLMTFSMQRMDVMSFGDLAILRGLRMVYHHRVITKDLFAKYQRRYSPYATVASLYLWAVAGGAIDGMRDYAPKKRS